jgi:hypothetical protein
MADTTRANIILVEDGAGPGEYDGYRLGLGKTPAGHKAGTKPPGKKAMLDSDPGYYVVL